MPSPFGLVTNIAYGYEARQGDDAPNSEIPSSKYTESRDIKDQRLPVCQAEH